MKKLLLIFFAFFLHNAFAEGVTTKTWDPKPMIQGNRRVDEIMEWAKLHPGTMPPLTEEEKYHYFIKEGIPVPGSGASIRPMNTIKADLKQDGQIQQYISSQNKNGYVKRFSTEAKMLFSMPELAARDLEEHKLMNLEPQDTHMRANAYDLVMNYKYSPLSPNLIEKVIGFAPEHTYVENGWNGAVEFFIPHFYDSVCAFHEVNIKLTGSSAIIPTEVATYKVNNKITTIATEGNNESGYIYKIEWWDKTFRRALECAAKTYSDDTKEEVLGLAKIIDMNR